MLLFIESIYLLTKNKICLIILLIPLITGLWLLKTWGFPKLTFSPHAVLTYFGYWDKS